MTASTGWPELTAFLRRTGCVCLEKPFDAARLRAIVNDLVSTAPRR